MTPRQHLEQALIHEKAGSPVIKALSDMVTLQYVETNYQAAMQDRENVPDVEVLKLLLERSAIIETIRKRRFGKHAKAYNKVWDDFELYVQPYYDEATSSHPAKAIFEDLQEINNGKSELKNATKFRYAATGE
jgi:hypothetical protein